MEEDKDSINYIVCRLCQKKFKKITNTHLKKFHNMTMKEYMKKFPNSCIVSENLRGVYGDKTRGKTYEELYGEKKGKKLRKRKSKTLIKTYKENDQLKKDKGMTMKKYHEKKKRKRGFKKSTCKVCSKIYWYNPKDSGGIYCSIRCRDRDHKAVALDVWRTSRAHERTIKTRIIEERGKICEKCGGEVEKISGLCLHHITYDYYSSDFSNYLLLCKSCHTKLHNKLRRETQSFVGLNSIKRTVYELLKALKIPLDDPNFIDTPRRISRMYIELCSGLFIDFKKEIKNILSTMFPSANNKMIIYSGTTSGMCPHHLLPVIYEFHIGIIPKGYVIGASKPQRLVELYCSIPSLQEDITTNVMDMLTKMLKPEGVFVLLHGEHMCMRIRGVKSGSSKLITSAISGSFKQAAVRAEFLSLIKE